MKRCCNSKCNAEFDTPGIQCERCRNRATKITKVETVSDLNTAGLPLSLLGALIATSRKRGKRQ